MSEVDAISKYKLVGRLGRGGMAEVFLAVTQGPAGFTKLQVVKMLHGNLLDNAEFVKMFLHEARLAALLNHPNVVQTNEVGYENGRCFLVMEYLDGQSLNAILAGFARKEAVFPLTQHLRVLAEVLAGLHYAHELADLAGNPLGLVHRDVSPHNIVVCYDGAVKLLDFGIAKATASSPETQTDMMKGKIRFMAPEQVAKEHLDRRADIFQVGIMFAQAVTGQPYWPKSDDPMAIVGKLFRGDLPHLDELGASVDDDLMTIARRAVAFKREDRYSTAEEFRKDVEAAIARRDTAVTPRLVGETVAVLFADSRAKIKKHIEESLQGLRASEISLEEVMGTGSHGVPELASSGSNPRAITGSFTPMGSRRSGPVSVTSIQGGAMAAPIQPDKSKRSLLIAGGVAAIAAVAIVAFFVRPGMSRGEKVATTPIGAGEAVPNASTSPAPSTPVAPSKIEIRLSVEPASATLFLDGVQLPGNPYTGRVEEDGKLHKIRAEAPGYTTREVEANWSVSPSVSLTLVPGQRRVPGVAGPAPKATTKAPSTTTATVAPPKIRDER